ncbi:hypothetical protein LPJ75_002566, partial [Coemansia sp. RSA 2598]
MACPNGGCNLTRALLDIASMRNCTPRKALSELGALSSSTDSSPQLSEKQLSDLETASTASSVEPGDSFGFDHSTSVSQQIIEETLRLANKAAASTSSVVPAVQQKNAAAQIGLLSSLVGEDDALPPSYHNLGFNIGSLANTATEKKSSASTDSAAHNNAAAAAVPHREPPAVLEAVATDTDSAPGIDQKLVEANRYLMRRVRKLELTNQIIKEAYDEVQEILLAERQSKATQLQALERKHQDDMLKLVEEYQKREGEKEGCSLYGIESELSSYNFESSRASRASTTKSVTAYPDNSGVSLSTFDIEFCDAESLSSDHSSGSPFIAPRHVADDVSKNVSLPASSSDASTGTSTASPSREPGSSLPQPRSVTRSVASKAVPPPSSNSDDDSSDSDNDGDDDDDEEELDGISITWARDISAGFGADKDADSDSESDTDSEYSDGSNDSSSDDDGDDDSDDDEEDDFDDDGWVDDPSSKGAFAGDRRVYESTFSNHQSSDAESDLDFSFDSEPETDLANIFDRFNRDSEPSTRDDAQPSAPHLQHLLSPDDYIGIDPAAAVISRYYANNTGTLDIAADIDDIPTDGYDRDDSTEVAGERYAESDAEILDSLSPHSVWEAMRDPSTANVVEDAGKSKEDLEMEVIVHLPADQRIAKFVNRASSHLQQGARGGLSLGFMLHNLEILAAQFASNHISILCAFIESLYRLAEAIGDGPSDSGSSKTSAQSATDAAATPPSALAKKLREDRQSRREAVLRVVKLLHTFITLPDDQSAVLHLLEKLSEANQGTRLGIHAMLLRTLYENELLDSGSINEWYGDQPAEQPADEQHAHLIRKNAMPLLHRLAEDAANTTLLMEEIQHQVLQTSGGTSSSTALSTPSQLGSSTRTCWAGSLTPVSDENTTVTSQSSDSECTERSDDRARASSSNGDIK